MNLPAHLTEIQFYINYTYQMLFKCNNMSQKLYHIITIYLLHAFFRSCILFYRYIEIYLLNCYFQCFCCAK